MINKEYDILIDATPSKIWDVLWADESYRKWTSVFSEGSNAVTDWKTGSKILFLDGKGQGMISRVEENRPEEYMSIKHIGVIKDGNEIYEGSDVDEWSGSMENYTLTREHDKIRLKVAIDLSEKWFDYFDKTWSKALKKVKELAEH